MRSCSPVRTLAPALMCLLLMGCASNQMSGPAPVRIGSLIPVTALHIPTWVASLKAAARDVNQHGGIQGRPVRIENCDDGQNPNGAQTCARKLVADHVIAVAGSLTALSMVETPILDEAGIPQVGNQALNPEDFTLPTAFPLDGGLYVDTAGELFGAKQRGLQSVFVVTYDNPTGKLFLGLVTQLCQAIGLNLVGQAFVPLAATNFSSYAAAAVQSHADLVFPQMPDPSLSGFLTASKQAGGRYALAMPYGEIPPNEMAELGGAQGPTENSVEFSGVPPVGALDVFPALRTYKADMDALLASGDEAAAVGGRTGGTLEGWLAVMVIAKLAKSLHTVSARSLLQALRTRPTVDTLGLTAPWRPGSNGPPSMPRITNGAGYFIAQKNGVDVLVDPKPFDVFKALGMNTGI